MLSSKPLFEICTVSSAVEQGVQALSMKRAKNGMGVNFMGVMMG